MVVHVWERHACRRPAEPNERRRFAGATGEERALRRDAVFGEALARDAQVALGLVAEGVVQVARADDDPLSGLRAWQRAARLHRHHIRLARDEPLLGGEARSVEAGLLGAREHRVDVVRPLILRERDKGADDERAPREVVGRAKAQLVAVHLDRGHVQHRELPFAERSFGADPADLARVVDRIDDRLRLVQRGTDGGSAQIVVDGDRDFAREDPLPESP